MKIQNDVDYDRVMSEIDHIFGKIDNGTASANERARLEALTDAIMIYEDENYPIPEPVLKARAIWWFTMRTRIGYWLAKLIWRK